MNEKRFTITQDFEEHHRQIRDNGKIIMGCFIEPQAEVIVDLLNELATKCSKLEKENEQLKKQWKEKRHEDINELSVIAMRYKALEKENEQLKSENQELRMSPRVDVNEIESLVCENQRLENENEQLKHELETIKNILFDLKEIESYWDSSILQNVIDNIAETVGVDLDD